MIWILQGHDHRRGDDVFERFTERELARRRLIDNPAVEGVVYQIDDSIAGPLDLEQGEPIEYRSFGIVMEGQRRGHWQPWPCAG